MFSMDGETVALLRAFLLDRTAALQSLLNHSVLTEHLPGLLLGIESAAIVRSFSLKDSMLSLPVSVFSIVSSLEHASEKACQSALSSFQVGTASRSSFWLDLTSTGM